MIKKAATTHHNGEPTRSRKVGQIQFSAVVDNRLTPSATAIWGDHTNQDAPPEPTSCRGDGECWNKGGSTHLARNCVLPTLARALVAAGVRVEEMERWAHFAEAATRKPGLSVPLARATQVGVGLLRWSSTYYAGDMDTALGCVQQVLQLLADEPAPWHANAQLALGFCLYRKHRFRDAQTALSHACA
jgi:hypothetical protein